MELEFQLGCELAWTVEPTKGAGGLQAGEATPDCRGVSAGLGALPSLHGYTVVPLSRYNIFSFPKATHNFVSDGSFIILMTK